MKKLVLLVTSFAIISGVLAALPCNSRLRKTRPNLFKHCGNNCPYGQWGSWSIISKFQTNQCNSSKAYNQTRSRHSFIETCPSESESKIMCKCINFSCIVATYTYIAMVLNLLAIYISMHAKDTYIHTYVLTVPL